MNSIKNLQYSLIEKAVELAVYQRTGEFVDLVYYSLQEEYYTGNNDYKEVCVVGVLPRNRTKLQWYMLSWSFNKERFMSCSKIHTPFQLTQN